MDPKIRLTNRIHVIWIIKITIQKINLGFGFGFGFQYFWSLQVILNDLKKKFESSLKNL